jgi:hypothetical protein
MVKPTQQTNQGSKWRNERTCALVEPFMMAAEGSGDPGNRVRVGLSAISSTLQLITRAHL